MHIGFPSVSPLSSFAFEFLCKFSNVVSGTNTQEGFRVQGHQGNMKLFLLR